VTASNASFLLTSAGGSAVNVGNSPPDSDGDYAPGWADFSTNYDSGAGVLERITLQVVGSGVTTLDVGQDPAMIGNPALADSQSAAYTIGTKLAATVRTDGSACP
jgi:hypothetical protein